MEHIGPDPTEFNNLAADPDYQAVFDDMMLAWVESVQEKGVVLLESPS